MIKQSGIALIQVLLITAILTVFAMFFVKTAQNQVEMSQWATDRALAEVKLHSALNQLIFTLFTNQKETIAATDNGTEVTEVWNFFNKPFQLNEYVSVKMQDQSGLLSVHFLDKTIFTTFLIKNGIETSRAEKIADHLLDWQDIDNIPRPFGAEKQVGALFRNGYIPDLKDIENAIELTEQEKQLIYENTTIYFNGSLNPLTASKELITAFSDEFSAQIFTARREAGENLTSIDFKQITGAEQMDIMTFAPANTLSIELTAHVGQAIVTKHLVISLSRYAVGKASPIFTLLEKS